MLTVYSRGQHNPARSWGALMQTCKTNLGGNQQWIGTSAKNPVDGCDNVTLPYPSSLTQAPRRCFELGLLWAFGLLLELSGLRTSEYDLFDGRRAQLMRHNLRKEPEIALFPCVCRKTRPAGRMPDLRGTLDQGSKEHLSLVPRINLHRTPATPRNPRSPDFAKMHEGACWHQVYTWCL